jgi:hypothetical protein
MISVTHFLTADAAFAQRAGTVKVHATALLAEALDVPSAFEPLLDVAPGGGVTVRPSDRDPAS